MTDHHHSTLPEELLEAIADNSLEGLPERMR